MTSTADGRVGRLRVDVVDDAAAAGLAAADELLDAVATASASGRGAVLGCPAGRTPRAAFATFATLAAERGVDLSGVEIVMMDEYVHHDSDGVHLCPDDAHYSCRRAAELDLRRTVDDHLPAHRGIRPDAVHVPDPADGDAFDRLIAELGGIDLFLLASGATDGHVAFNPPGTPIDSSTRVVRLADTTRRDNLSTFPAFAALDEVPQHGVTVGLGTIVRSSRRVLLLLVGRDKHDSYRRVIGASDFDPSWPATVVHRCRDARLVADRAAADGTRHQA